MVMINKLQIKTDLPLIFIFDQMFCFEKQNNVFWTNKKNENFCTCERASISTAAGRLQRHRIYKTTKKSLHLSTL